MKEINVTLDEKFLKKFFKLTGVEIDENEEITLSSLRKNLDIMDEQIKEYKETIKNNKPGYQRKNDGPVLAKDSDYELKNAGAGAIEYNGPKKTIFVIDDLGVITYQLKVAFEQMGYDVITSNEVYDAIEKFKRSKCDIVLMDLFIPTEREGFILLEELKKLAAPTQRPIKIGIMTTSLKKEHKQICKMKGAEFYIEKVEDWQKQICQVIKNLDK
ncbi:MAG: response regulator [Candidatus Gastranaerophilaceae bacterium]